MSVPVRGDIAGRPRVPWKGAGGVPRETTGVEAAGRGVVMVGGLLNPVLAAAAGLLVLGCARARLRGSRLLVVAIVAAIAGLLLGAFRSYLRPWREVIAVGRENAPAGAGPASDAVKALASERWAAWVVAQLPFAVLAGLVVAGVVLYRRQRYSAEWRVARKKVTTRQVARAVEQVEAARVREVPPVDRIEDLVLVPGVDLDSGKPFTLLALALGMHMLTTGPTGFGKSTTVQVITDGLLSSPAARKLRLPCVFLDMKADPGMREFLRRQAEATGRRCHVVTVDGRRGSTTWNALRHGTPEELRNKLMEAEAHASDGGFTEPHHRKVGQRFLLLACHVLDELVRGGQVDTVGGQRRRWRRDLPDLVRLLHLPEIGKRTDRLSPELADRVRAYAERMAADRDLAKSLSGIYERFADYVEGTAGPVFAAADDGLDLYEAISGGDVVLFSLDAAADAAAARQIGNLALQDLTLVLAQLQRERFRESGRLCWIVVDEFSALGGSLLLGLFTRARSAGGAVCLSTQDLADLRAVDEQLERAVLTNANVVVSHRQKGTAAAERAEAIGTEEVYEETVQVTEDTDALGSRTAGSGVGSLRAVDRFLVHPNELKSLPQGGTIWQVDHPVSAVSRVRIVPPAARTSAGPPMSTAKVQAAPMPTPLPEVDPDDRDDLAGAHAGSSSRARVDEHQVNEVDEVDKQSTVEVGTTIPAAGGAGDPERAGSVAVTAADPFAAVRAAWDEE